MPNAKVNNNEIKLITLFVEHAGFAGDKITVRQTSVVCWK